MGTTLALPQPQPHPKICPLFSIAFGREERCIKERCAFWNRATFDCGLIVRGR